MLRLDPVPARVVRRTTRHAGVAPVLGAPVADMEGTEAAAIVASSPWAAAAMRPERRRGAGDAVDACAARAAAVLDRVLYFVMAGPWTCRYGTSGWGVRM